LGDPEAPREEGEEVKDPAAFAKWLQENHVTCMSPAVGMVLLDIQSKLSGALGLSDARTINAPREILVDAEEYSRALEVVCTVGKFQMGIVIKRFESLINEMTGGRSA